MTKNALNVKLLPLLLALFTLLAACQDKHEKPLPILGNYDLNYRKVDGKTITDTIYQVIPDFQFFNEDSVLVSKDTYKDKVWITEFFFATCPSICPIMNTQLKNVEKALKRYSKDLQYLSFTIDPKHDTPSVLKAHKSKLGIQNKNWAFLCGDESFTHQLGIEHFLIFAGREADALGGYAHSGAFTLVDKKGHVRGVYEVVQPDLSVNQKEFQRLIKEAKKLFQDEYNYSNE
jgi:protein SCO1/2